MKSVLAVTLAAAMCPLAPAVDEIGGGSSSEALAAEGSVVSDESTETWTDWAEWGTCVWAIGTEGTLIVKPADEKTEGTIPGGEAPWQGKASSIKSVRFEGKCTVVAKDGSASCSEWFKGCKYLTTADLSGLDTSSVKSMKEVFCECCALESLDLSEWVTSSVTDMSGMFESCEKLASLDLSGWVTSNVTDMNRMFAACSKLSSVGDISEWDTSSVTDMSIMFGWCSSLASLDLSGWSTESLTDMGYMFNSCSAMRDITLGKDFSFAGSGGDRKCSLPTPSGEGLTGLWVSSADGTAYAPDSIPSSKAATYTAQMEIGEGLFDNLVLPGSACYTGRPVTASVSSKSLTEGADYEVFYSDNVNAGVAKMLIVGKGNYAGTLRYEFGIAKATPAVPIGLTATYGQTLGNVALPQGWSWDAATTSVGDAGNHTFKASYTPEGEDATNYEAASGVAVAVKVAAKAIDASMFAVDTSDATYTGKAIDGRVFSKDLKEGTDYEVAYSDNVNAGTAKVTIKGKGNYSGTLSYSFKIAAAPEPTPSPEPEPTPDPEPSPDPEPTPDPAPTPDPEPTPTPTPDPTPDPEPSPSPAPEVTFPDVDSSQWYAGGVAFCAEEGLMTGYAEGDDAGLFGVGRSLTRAELASILWRHAEPAAHEAYAGADNATGMADVADDAWYTGAANWAVKAGVINGFDEGDHREFRPNDPVTAEQLAAILANYADPDGAESADLGLLSGFADSDAISDWARGSVAWAKAKDIVNGYDEGGVRYLKPCEEIARERVATILMNAFESGVLK